MTETTVGAVCAFMSIVLYSQLLGVVFMFSSCAVGCSADEERGSFPTPQPQGVTYILDAGNSSSSAQFYGLRLPKVLYRCSPCLCDSQFV